MIPRPKASVSPGNLLEVQIFRIYPKPTESVTLGMGSMFIQDLQVILRHIQPWDPLLYTKVLMINNRSL